MKAALSWMGSLITALGLGTLISVLVIAGMLWGKGVLTDERLLGMFAALQGIKTSPPPASAARETDAEQASIEQVLSSRMKASLDLDLRESAIDKALGDLRTIETSLQLETKRLDNWKQSFDKRLADLQNAAADSSLREVQQTLETIKPQQAKEQLVKMLEDPKSPTDDPMEAIVRILKAMPLDKRKKILEQFKTPEDNKILAEILRVIRLGGSDSELLRDTRSQLQQPGTSL
jgi:hypothetical protein